MTARTIVGSGPARRPLPMGREAVERAIRCRSNWPHPDYGYEQHPWWLPDEIADETVDQLRERLRGMP